MFTQLKPTRRQIILSLVICLLVITNLCTVIYYKNSISNLKKRSSFVAVTQSAHSGSFKQCLQKVGIEFEIEGDKVKVREVERDDAIASCS